MRSQGCCEAKTELHYSVLNSRKHAKGLGESFRDHDALLSWSKFLGVKDALAIGLFIVWAYDCSLPKSRLKSDTHIYDYAYGQYWALIGNVTSIQLRLPLCPDLHSYVPHMLSQYNAHRLDSYRTLTHLNLSLPPTNPCQSRTLLSTKLYIPLHHVRLFSSWMPDIEEDERRHHWHRFKYIRIDLMRYQVPAVPLTELNNAVDRAYTPRSARQLPHHQ